MMEKKRKIDKMERKSKHKYLKKIEKEEKMTMERKNHTRRRKEKL